MKFIQKNVPDQRETVFNISAENTGNKLILKGDTDSKELKDKLFTELKSSNPVDRITMLPDNSVGNKKFGLINISVANMRAAPSYSAELVTQGLMGTPIKILKR
ncbi:MAG: SH3 domain-containing protein, partial [Prolixibacteraceae bacterium]|nr:SH3 domain-containing protein [Prolixibacteraceae bacterium]